MDIDPKLVTSASELGELAIKAWAAKDLVKQLLGPTAEYLGGEVRGLVEKCNVNVDRIFRFAVRKTGSRIDAPGQVNPRVLRGVINEGAYTEDELAAEYFGGVLASARTEDGRDDRGVAFVALVRDLSSYQLRLHYLLYRSVRAFFRGHVNLAVGVPADRARMRIYIPLSIFSAEVGASDDTVGPLLEHTVHGLARAGLIDAPFFFGNHEYVKQGWPDATGPGVLLIPSAFGTELYLWAHGHGNLPVRRFLDGSVQFADSDEKSIPQDVLAVPRPEDVEALKREIELTVRELDKHIALMQSRLTEQRYQPAFPNDLREHIRQIAERMAEISDGVASFWIEKNLDDCLRPPDDATDEKRIELVKALKSQLMRAVEKKPDTA